MGIIDFYATTHIKQCQTLKEKIANANAIAHCEQAFMACFHCTTVNIKVIHIVQKWVNFYAAIPAKENAIVNYLM